MSKKKMTLQDVIPVPVIKIREGFSGRKRQSMQPELIRVINSKKRVLEIDYNYNTCDLRMEVSNEDNAITLNESEAKRLHKALSRFLDFREHLHDSF